MPEVYLNDLLFHNGYGFFLIPIDLIRHGNLKPRFLFCLFDRRAIDPGIRDLRQFTFRLHLYLNCCFRFLPPLLAGPQTEDYCCTKCYCDNILSFHFDFPLCMYLSGKYRSTYYTDEGGEMLQGMK